MTEFRTPHSALSQAAPSGPKRPTLLDLKVAFRSTINFSLISLRLGVDTFFPSQMREINHLRWNLPTDPGLLAAPRKELGEKVG
jgi:hypothetical protein